MPRGIRKLNDYFLFICVVRALVSLRILSAQEDLLLGQFGAPTQPSLTLCVPPFLRAQRLGLGHLAAVEVWKSSAGI
jgi:hypothetical protein